MSGGHFNYEDSRLRDEIFQWSDKPTNVFEDIEISMLVWDIFDLIHDYDWYVSGDTCEETYLEAKAKFKKKWFGNRSVRIRKIVDDSVAELRSELYKTFDLAEENE